MSGMPDGMIITKKECMLLAAGAGVPALFGRFSDAGEESEEELLQQLFQMSKDGLIRVSDCKIEADAYLQEAFATVRESRKILTVYPGTGFGQPFYFYLSGNSAVWMRESMLDSEELYVSLIEAGQVWEAVEETCELPDVAFPPGLLRELDVREEMEICFRPVAELWTAGKISLILDLQDIRARKTEMRMLLLEEDLYPQLILQTGEWQEKAYYSRQRMQEWTERIAYLGGEEKRL